MTDKANDTLFDVLVDTSQLEELLAESNVACQWKDPKCSRPAAYVFTLSCPHRSMGGLMCKQHKHILSGLLKTWDFIGRNSRTTRCWHPGCSLSDMTWNSRPI